MSVAITVIISRGTLSLLVPMMDTCDGVDLDHTLIFGKVKEDNNIKALDSHPSAAAVAKVAQSSAAHKTSRRTKDNLLASGPQTRANIPSNDDSDEEDGMGLGTLFGQDDDGDDDSDGDGMGLGNLFDEDDDSSSEDGMGLGNLFGQEEDDDDDDDDDDEDMGLDTLFAQGQGDDYNGGSKKSNSAPGNADMERHNQIDEATSGSGILSVQELYQAIFELARDSVQATPVIALSPLFETAVSAGKHIVKLSASSDQREKSSLLGSLNMIIGE